MALAGTRYSTLPVPTQSPPPRVHHTPPPPTPATRRAAAAGGKVGVGLKSVAQLSLYTHFSGFQGITEVYNLGVAGNPNDHNVICGTD